MNNAIDHSTSSALIEGLVSILSKPEKKTSTQGTVTRIDDNGTCWVRFYGADADTPCIRSTVTSKPNDTVSVSVIKGRATITGNISSPASDNTVALDGLSKAIAAMDAANIAATSAQNAIKDAQNAKTAAVSAATSAREAASSSQDAKESADAASEDAKRAMSNALASLAQLGAVEDVLGTLEWIKGNELYSPATTYDPSKTYYIYADGKYVQVDEVDEDNITNYYVYDQKKTMAAFMQRHLTMTEKGLYITQSQPRVYKPEDSAYEYYVKATKWDEKETYYKWGWRFIPGTDDDTEPVWTEVANPTKDDLSRYYVKVSNAGNIFPPGTGYMLLTGNATEIYNGSGSLIARYGETIQLGADGVATIDQTTMHITRVEVTDEYQINNWVWKQRENGNISFKWRETA